MESCYEFIGETESGFRDIQKRIARSRSMEKAVLTGGSTSQMIGATIVNEGGSVAKPMPGRYQVGNELGQGAIGIV